MDGTATNEPKLSNASDNSYGLRPQVLSPLETLTQSISAIAPSTSAALTVPLVFALAGEGTCLAYIIAMCGMILIALCIVTFARDSASPGSLYIYAHQTLSPTWAAVTAWSLCFAYLVTAASLIGGFTSMTFALLGHSGSHLPQLLVAAVGAGCAIFVAYRDIQVSARVMLLIEVISVALVVAVVGIIVWRAGPHLDWPQLRGRDMTASSVRLGVVLAVFSFVGFESATSLGSEARNPLKTIPRAVIWSTVLSGLFFVGCAYGEVLAFRGSHPGLADSPAPLRVLSTRAGLGFIGPLIDAGVLVSMFAGTLAFIIAVARLLMLMAHHRLVGKALGKTSKRHGTPTSAGLLAGLVAFAPVAVLMLRGSSGTDVYGWLASLSVFGFLAAYALVAVATINHRRKQGRLNSGTIVLAMLATVAMFAVALGTLFPIPPAPYRYFPVVYFAFMATALVWHSGLRPRALRL